ncbi:large ribosomal subunit protein P2-like isoform X4 [Chrysemys picta bellii]|uniref:large ribosomal subunit protein P2-like isoform X4 n=1 Tax=Chrysemys picta bellii TaxID=8478 RepID=UPI0032B1DBCE
MVKAAVELHRVVGQSALDHVIGELNGNNIEDVIAQGNGKLASMPVGGAVAVSAGPGSAAPAAAEEKEESDNDMECGLFD